MNRVEKKTRSLLDVACWALAGCAGAYLVVVVLRVAYMLITGTPPVTVHTF